MTMKIKSWFTVIFFLGTACFIFAQENENAYVLNVDKAVALALENNVSVERSVISLKNAETAKKYGWNSAAPSLKGGVSSSIPLNSVSDTSVDLSVTLSLNLTANLFSQIKNTKNAWEQSEISFRQAVRDVEKSVRQAFYTLIYEKENILLQEENLKNAKTQYENNLVKYSNGRLSEIDAISAEVSYKQKIPLVEQARTTFQNDLDSFKQILGLKIQDKVELEGSLDDILFLGEITLEGMDFNSDEVKLLEKKLEGAEISVLDGKFSAYAPSISSSVKWNDKIYSGELKNSSSFSASLSASIPLDGVFPWSNQNIAVKKAENSVTDLQLQLSDAKKDFLREIQSSLRSIRQIQESIKYSQANIALAEKTFLMTQEAYSRGTKDLLTLQNAGTTLLNAQVTLNSNILSLGKTILELENSIGCDFCSLTKEKK